MSHSAENLEVFSTCIEKLPNSPTGPKITEDVALEAAKSKFSLTENLKNRKLSGKMFLISFLFRTVFDSAEKCQELFMLAKRCFCLRLKEGNSVACLFFFKKSRLVLKNHKTVHFDLFSTFESINKNCSTSLSAKNLKMRHVRFFIIRECFLVR